MGYCDYTNAWVFALTRERRREAAARRAAKPCIRYTAEQPTPEFEPIRLSIVSQRARFRDEKQAARLKRRELNMRRKRPEVVRGNNLPLPVFLAIWEAQDGRCYLCGHPFTDDDWSTEDHVTPWARGGRNAKNLLLAHQGCNTVKADRAPKPCELLYLEAAALRADRVLGRAQAPMSHSHSPSQSHVQCS